MSKLATLVKRVFVHNWRMKLVALIFAFILWSFVIAEENPTRTKIFQDVPVTYAAADELRQKGLTSSTPLTEILNSVTVTAEAPATALDYLNENMLEVSVDLSQINEAGEYVLRVEGKTTLTQGRVISVEPSTITVNVEEIVTRTVPVDVQLKNQQEGYYYGEPILETETVDVTGARSNVESIARAVCTIDVGDMKEPTTASYTVSFVDSNGEEIRSNLFVGSTAVIAEVPVYPEKTVSIDVATVKNTITGLAEGYEIAELAVEPQTVNIAGENENIEGITSVTLESIDLDDATGNVVLEANVKLPEGVIAVDPSVVQVQLTITQPEFDQTYSAVSIETRNLEDSNLNVSISPAAVDITVYGTQAALGDFNASKLKPFVDLAGLGKGIHRNIPIKFENEPDLDVRLVASTPNVTVTVS